MTLDASEQLRIFNKGLLPLTVPLPRGVIEIGVDDFYDTAPVGEELGLGCHLIDSTPFPSLTLCVRAP